jgi:2-polyprenyl-3-methyl-5-hydroxy-6-metoxy-1,4-benzoquinol methylase
MREVRQSVFGSMLRKALRRRYVAAPLNRIVDRVGPGLWLGPEARANAMRARALTLVDVTTHNAGATPPRFETVVSQVVSAAQFSEPTFERVRRIMFPGAVRIPWGATPAAIDVPHRKLWEFCYILRGAEQHGKLKPGLSAVGFGVGQEPIPAALARFGLSILATDLDPNADASVAWAATGQHLSQSSALSRPEVISDALLEEHVRMRPVDMNEIPDDLGRFDFVWSACALEHLGSPRAGIEFIIRTLELLEPGGIAIHTTELELTPRAETADYGHMAVYRVADLNKLVARVRSRGFEMDANWYVAMDSPADRWISLPPYPHDDPAHLKLTIGESVSTSVGLVIRRPA